MLGIQDTPGAAIRRSDVALLSRIKYSAAVVADVLAEAGMLQEDRSPAVVRWFRAAITDLPEPMRHELGVWFDIMRNGSSTSRRGPGLARTPPPTASCGGRCPRCGTGPDGHQSLREIGRDDVLAVLPPSGHAAGVHASRACGRSSASSRAASWCSSTRPRGSAPRSQLRRSPPRSTSTVSALPWTPPTRPRAVLAALLAFHAVRIYQLCALRLTDRPRRAAARRRRRSSCSPSRSGSGWPATWTSGSRPGRTRSTPTCSCTSATPATARHVTPQWIRKQLGMSGQLIRLDRIFDEAQATGGDLRALCDLFGLSVAGAYRYTSVLDRVDYPQRAGPREPS